MRLTLRTLLAYLDNSSVLKPEEAELLAKKIQESEFASGLVNRIQAVIHKLRMPAPKVDAKGIADINSVAEYIDGSLADERVADFEKLCLESDIHLSEVVSALQILGKVMAEPQAPPPALRERVYGLFALRDQLPAVAPEAGRIDGAHPSGAVHEDGRGEQAGSHDTPISRTDSTAELAAASAEKAKAAADSKPAAPSDAAAQKPQAEDSAESGPAAPAQVPDYLLAARGPSWISYATVAVVALLVVFGLLRLMGPFSSQHPLAGLLGFSREIAQAPPVSPIPPVDPQSPLPLPPGPPSPALPPAETPPATNPPGEPAPALPPAVPPGDNPPVVAPPPPANPPGAVPPPAIPAIPPPPPPADPATPPAAKLPTEGNVLTAPPGPFNNAPGVAVGPPKPVEPTPEPGPVLEVGRLVSDDQPLAQLVDDGKGNGPLWFRLPPRALLPAEQRLVSLPVFRPQLALPSGVQATLIGESSLWLTRQKETGAPRIELEYGRVLLISVSGEGSTVALQLGPVAGELAMTSPDSAVAVEVRKFLPPGVDPVRNPEGVLTYADLYVTGGEVVWRQGEETTKLAAHSALAIGRENLIYDKVEPPAWLDSRSISDIDRRAALELEPLLEVQKPLEVPLLEQVGGRRIEGRSLASRCLGALDDFEPLLKQIADARQYAYWAGDIETLRSYAAAGAKRAAAIQESLRLLRGKDADALYRMLIGHDNVQLAGGAAAELVQNLEHESLDVRVLAIDELRRITGKMLLYRPERLQDSNSRAAIQRWKENLKTGIQFASPPTGASEYKPLKPAS